jgi:hypothetical protein
MQQRISRLESLVKTLLAEGQQKSQELAGSVPEHNVAAMVNEPASTNYDANLPCRAGTTVIDGGQSVYKAGNDWSDVLQEVRLLVGFYVYCSIINSNQNHTVTNSRTYPIFQACEEGRSYFDRLNSNCTCAKFCR